MRNALSLSAVLLMSAVVAADPPPVVADPPPLESRVADLERANAELRRELAELKARLGVPTAAVSVHPPVLPAVTAHTPVYYHPTAGFNPATHQPLFRRPVFTGVRGLFAPACVGGVCR